MLPALPYVREHLSFPGHKGRDKNEQTENLKKEVEELTKEVKGLYCLDRDSSALLL